MDTNAQVNVTEAMPTVLPEVPAVEPETTSKGDMVFGIVGSVVVLLAVPTVIRGIKWVTGKVKGLMKPKDVADVAHDENKEEN